MQQQYDIYNQHVHDYCSTFDYQYVHYNAGSDYYDNHSGSDFNNNYYSISDYDNDCSAYNDVHVNLYYIDYINNNSSANDYDFYINVHFYDYGGSNHYNQHDNCPADNYEHYHKPA
jgi:hypothetical protein